MASLPPKIDQRTYEEIVQQIEVLAEDFTNDVEGGGWKPPGAIEIEPKPELLSGLILNENIPTIIVEPTVADLTGRILNEEVDLGNNKIIKQGTLVNDNLAQNIVQVKGKESVKVLLLRNTLIDTTLAEEISQIKGSTKVKVKVKPPAVIEVERKNWLDQTLAEDIGNIKSGTVINEDIAQKITAQGRSKVKVKVETDAGQALIRIFATMVKSVSDRLNQVPEKNFLAFLDLIGEQLKPPQPAKVPLTFYLAEGSPVDGLVPAHTQISAPPVEGSEEEIVFETDRELVVTTAQLKAVFVREPSQDKYQDCTLAAIGEKEAAFLAFEGDRPIEHSLYISFSEIFSLSLPELENLNLIITGDTNKFQNLQENNKLDWFYWHDSQWHKVENPSYGNNQFIFTDLPIPNDSAIHGKTAKWLKVKLTNLSSISEYLLQITNIQGSINLTKYDLISEVCLFNNTLLDLSKDFDPFGEQPQLNDTFYLALHDTFIKPNTAITINIELSHKPVHKDNLKITWEIGNGQVWQAIAVNEDEEKEEYEEVSWIEDSKLDFTESEQEATLKFPNKENMPSPSTVNGETRYWIRARITQGHYGKAASERQYPVYDDLAVLTEEVKKNVQEIKVDSVDLFQDGNTIRLFPNTGGFPEEHKITIPESEENTIPESENKLTLNNGIINESLAVGTRVMRKSIITETIPPTYDPPLVKSLKLTYEFTLTEDAIYFANNDSIYSHPFPFITQLQQEAKVGDKLLSLGEVKGLSVGDFLTINNSENNSDKYQIESINSETNEVILTSTVNKKYNKDTPVNRYFRPFTPTVDEDPTLYLGFDKSLDNKTVTLYSQVKPPSPEELSTDITTETVKPKLVWEYSSSQGWQPLGVRDETQAFSQRGLIQFIAPADFSPIETFGQQLYWLRIRWQSGNFRVKPRLNRILTNTIWAIQASTIREEILGSSNADPNQIFVANNTPILQGQQLEIEEGQISPELEVDQVKVIRDDTGEIEAVWVKWHEVADFYSSGAGDRHYILDRQTGEIRFGDGLAGMIPPRGRNNIRLSFYLTGGGTQGNITSKTITQLKTTVPYIDRGINLEPSAGGAQQETLDSLKERVPKQLRHRDRAVTAEDIADLAYEASTDVARVKVVTPDLLTENFNPLNADFWIDPEQSRISQDEFKEAKKQEINKKTNNTEDSTKFETMYEDINARAGKIKLIILPYSQARQPTPSLALLEQVETFIRSRCEATVDLIVSASKWQEVTVTATITPVSIEGVDRVRNSVKERLEAFLHPLTGGKGKGWQFGRHPEKSDFYGIIQAIPGVDHVDFLEIDVGLTDANLSLSADTLIFSGNHTININSTRRT